MCRNGPTGRRSFRSGRPVSDSGRRRAHVSYAPCSGGGGRGVRVRLTGIATTSGSVGRDGNDGALARSRVGVALLHELPQPQSNPLRIGTEETDRLWPLGWSPFSAMPSITPPVALADSHDIPLLAPPSTINSYDRQPKHQRVTSPTHARATRRRGLGRRYIGREYSRADGEWRQARGRAERGQARRQWNATKSHKVVDHADGAFGAEQWISDVTPTE